jgi:hypothetical protein
MIRRLLFFLVLIAPLTPLAWAHKPSDAYLFIVAQNEAVSARWDIALRDLDAALDLDANGDRSLTWGEIRQQLPAITRTMQEGLRVTRGGDICLLQWGGFVTERRSDGNYLVASAAAPCGASGQALAVSYRLFANFDATHRGILSATVDRAEFTAVLNPSALQPKMIGPDSGTGFATFLLDGVHHILIGWDHILFLLCLILPCVLRHDGIAWHAAPALPPVLKRIAVTVTAFTLAHSITLALAAFEVFVPPPRWVESLIAVTVMFAAVNNIVPLIRERMALMALGFGFVHGFGFANVLAELQLPRQDFAGALLAFNLGVEAGQLLIVAAALLVLYPLRNMRMYQPALLKGGSAAAFLLASIWLTERVFDLTLISA